MIVTSLNRARHAVALPFEPKVAELPTHEHDRTGFDIGRDHARFGLVPPVDHLLPGHPVRSGWEASRRAFAGRTRRPTLHVRRWLELRLQAWLQGEPFDDLHVTPRLLRVMATDRCPITREPLQATGDGPEAACLLRLDPAAGCAPGNLVMLSRRAAQARGGRSWQQCLAVAAQLESQGGCVEDLDAGAWRRLATLLGFAAPLATAQAAALPLHLLPPVRTLVRSPVQALQVLLTLRFAQPGMSARLGEIGRLLPESARPALHAFMTTLLARRLAALGARPAPAPAVLREAMEDAWQHPLVRARWQRLVGQLDATQCEVIVRRGSALGLGGPGLRWIPSHTGHGGPSALAAESDGSLQPTRPHENPTPYKPPAASPQVALSFA